jgi:hypothetical protein
MKLLACILTPPLWLLSPHLGEVLPPRHQWALHLHLEWDSLLGTLPPVDLNRAKLLLSPYSPQARVSLPMCPSF